MECNLIIMKRNLKKFLYFSLFFSFSLLLTKFAEYFKVNEYRKYQYSNQNIFWIGKHSF